MLEGLDDISGVGTGDWLPALERAFNAAYPLHTGRLNLPYRPLLTASGLGLMTAGIFGLFGFLRRFRKKS